MAVTTMIGAKIHRREDPRLVSGHGRYVDDMVRPGMVHMAVVRSPLAHARIKSIDLAAAKKAPGVSAVLTFADFKDPIAHDEVVYQGEPVAVVLADERYQAADAAALVDVEYEALPAVMDIEKAMEANSPKAHSGAPDNIGWELHYAPENPDVMKEADGGVKGRV